MWTTHLFNLDSLSFSTPVKFLMTWKRAKARHQEQNEVEKDWISRSVYRQCLNNVKWLWVKSRKRKGAIYNNHLLTGFILGISGAILWRLVDSMELLEIRGHDFYYGKRHSSPLPVLHLAWSPLWLKYKSSVLMIQASVLQPETLLCFPKSGCCYKRNLPL